MMAHLEDSQAPMVQPETAAYWQAADEGRLLVKRCSACGEFHHYPRDLCPFCLSDATEWVEATGTGTVYSFSTMGQGEAAYTLAYVTLAEGPDDADQPGRRRTICVSRSASRCAWSSRPARAGPAVPMFTPV
jgi:uncharacterized OB-fold protein